MSSLLNVRRIAIYGFALMLLRTLASFIASGFSYQDENAGASLIPEYVFAYSLDAIAVTLVFLMFARSQEKSLLLNGLLIIALQEILSTILLSVIGASSNGSPLWFVDWAVLLASALLGMGIGRQLRSRVKPV